MCSAQASRLCYDPVAARISCLTAPGSPSGAGFATNRALDLDVPHNRLWLALAHGMGHTDLQTFGTERFCEGGPLDLGPVA